MLERRKEAILRIQAKYVAQVEQFFVVEESSLSEDSLVDRVYPCDDHIHHYNSKHITEECQRKFCRPVVIHLIKLNMAYSGFYEHTATRVESITAIILKQNQDQVVAHQDHEDVASSSPEQNAYEALSDKLDEGTEHTSHLESEERFEESNDEEVACERWLSHIQTHVRVKELFRALSRHLKVRLPSKENTPQIYDVPNSQKNEGDLEYSGLPAEELRERD